MVEVKIFKKHFFERVKRFIHKVLRYCKRTNVYRLLVNDNRRQIHLVVSSLGTHTPTLRSPFPRIHLYLHKAFQLMWIGRSVPLTNLHLESRHSCIKLNCSDPTRTHWPLYNRPVLGNSQIFSNTTKCFGTRNTSEEPS
jgi:hypothetical protein